VTTVIEGRSRLAPATALGLLLALGVPLITAAAGQLFYGSWWQAEGRVTAGLVIHWLNFAAVIAVVVVAERQSLASIGVKPLRWWTIAAGLVAAGVITVLTGLLVSSLKLSPPTEAAAYLRSLPFAMRLLLVITAGVFEETLFRGYAIERLTSIWGNKWLAGLVTVVLFTLGHLSLGANHVLPIGIVSVLVTLLYLWRRDLILNIITHSTIDGIALLVPSS
jgi:membrane protease YdiL (CAAX protease family)